MTLSVAVEDELAIARLSAEFAWRVDHDLGRGVEALFAASGVYESDGRQTIGKDAIKAAYVARASRGPRVARHVFTNLLLKAGDPLRATSIMILYARDGEGILPPVLSLIADVDDEYVRENGLWLIATRRLTTVFVDGANPPVFPFGQR